jgi:probable F420-dependent oxidoreductase
MTSISSSTEAKPATGKGASAAFKFWTTCPVPIEVGSDWRAGVRQLEDLGFDAVVMPDHFTDGWGVDPMVGMAAIAECTSRLRLASGVLGNDYRHPVQTHRTAATLDVVSDGRLVLGLGAGWLASDYAAAGLPLDPPVVRIARLRETVQIVKGLFGPDPLTFSGEHYTIKGLIGTPAPVQQPHPPILLGGGRPMALRLAGAEADIVGINTSTARGYSGAHSIEDLSAGSVDKKVAWAREGARIAGRNEDQLVLHTLHWLVRVTASMSEADELLSRVAARHQVSPSLLRESPGVLVGTVDQIVDVLLERRDRYGFSVLQLDAGFAIKNLAAFGPIIDRLCQ